jgi:HK97 family phage portal protein
VAGLRASRISRAWRSVILDGDPLSVGILTKLERLRGERKGTMYDGASFPLTSPMLGEYFGTGTVTGKAVTDASAMQVTTFFAGVRLLSETMGAFPSAIYAAEKNGNATKAEDHPLHEILVHQPNTDMNGVEFREASTANLSARGNAYAVIQRRSSGDVSSLYPVPSRDVQIKRDTTTDYQTRYGVPDRGKVEWYPPEKIWHRKLFSFGGLVGLSPIQCAREAIALALAGEEFNAKLFAQGLMPSARISIPQWLNDDQRKLANQRIHEMHTGLVNMNKPMLLEGGMKVESGLLTPDEAQFLQLRQFTVVEICRLLGIKPHMIAALERATDNNIEKLSLEFVMYTMLPHMRRDEVAVRKLLKPADRERFFYRYNFEGLLRADSVARAQLYSIFAQNGIRTRNEIRALENLNTSDDEGMNDFTIQLNMTAVQLLEELQRANVAGKNKEPTPTKAGDTNVYVTNPPVTVNHKAAPVNLTLPEFKQPDVKVDVHSAPVTVGTPNVEVHPQSVNVDMGETKFTEKLDELKEGLGELEHKINVSNENTAQRMADLAKTLSRPRKAVFDKQGNPIGMVTVESLDGAK